jgi:hypothetical protein
LRGVVEMFQRGRFQRRGRLDGVVHRFPASAHDQLLLAHDGRAAAAVGGPEQAGDRFGPPVFEHPAAHRARQVRFPGKPSLRLTFRDMGLALPALDRSGMETTDELPDGQVRGLRVLFQPGSR